MYLVYNLGRDPIESILSIALWLYLEYTTHPNLIHEISLLKPSLINALANEAVLCQKCLETSDAGNPLSYSSSIPLTAAIIQDTNLTLKVFNRKRYTIITGIKSVLNNVCCRIFTDILSHVYGIASTSTGSSTNGPPVPVIPPGFPHAVYGPFCPSRPDYDLGDERVWLDPVCRRPPSNDVNDEDKTMFLTFSKGFPVMEYEVLYLFRTLFGENCVAGLMMGSLVDDERLAAMAHMGEEPLYATMLVDSVETVDKILVGKRIAKYKINGKDIWARKYELRRVSLV